MVIIVYDSLDESWHLFFREEIEKEYFKGLMTFLDRERELGKVIYPSASNYFKAFELTSMSSIKVIILGQDPYIGPGQAQGLSFSVPHNMKLPPTLKNILKEACPKESVVHGDLSSWARQGVLLLNTILSVEQGQTNSHLGIGWETFTANVLEYVLSNHANLVFLAWGKYAHNQCMNVSDRHLVINTSHPSPLSSYRSGANYTAFKGSKCFDISNTWLLKHDVEPICWELTT
jgi:uracil-DNA glycosylase